jgi:hypothetical protein
VSTRNRELVFLIPALVLTTLGFALVYTQKSSTLTWSSLTYGALFLALFAIAHIGRRVLAPYADPYLLPVTALLSTLGILVIYRLNEKLALQQAMWLVVGLVAFLLVLVFVRDLKVLRDYRFVIGIAGLLLLLFTAIFGREINGARLWVAFGPVRFQPAEFGKILLVVFFAAYLVDIREALTVSTRRVLGVPLPPFRYLAPLLTIWVLSMVLMIFMKDLGTSLLFFGALLALLYVATGRFFYVVVGLVLFVAGAALLYFIFPHVQTRIDIWLDPWKDPSGKGYQIVQSLFALAAGGLFGRDRRGTGAGGGGGDHPALPDLHVPGLPHRGPGAGRLLQTAGHRAHQYLRFAGLSHHGRGHQIDPSYRHHAAVRELRRELDRGQFRAAGAALAHERPGGPRRGCRARAGTRARADLRPGPTDGRGGWVDGPASPSTLPVLYPALRGLVGADHLRPGMGRARSQGESGQYPGRRGRDEGGARRDPLRGRGGTGCQP